VFEIDIRRGINFDQDVTLRFENLPQSVSVELAQPVMKHGKKGKQVKVKVADDAALG
jgi:hypothetical protein